MTTSGTARPPGASRDRAVRTVPLIVLFLTLQRYWRLDLMSGSVKG
jgi:hypothetical protein